MECESRRWRRVIEGDEDALLSRGLADEGAKKMGGGGGDESGGKERSVLGYFCEKRKQVNE